jgi:two-component system response regulator YesN
LKLMLIEDEPDSLLGMKRVVESIEMEFTLLTSNHAEEALHIIQDESPELIVTDIMLPGMTGLDLVERFVHADYRPKVIIVSGYNDFEYARRSIQIGAVDYLVKPFETDEFKQKIEKSLLLIREEKAQLLEQKQQQTFAEIGNRSMRDEYLIDFCLRPAPLEEHLYHRLCLWEIEWLANKTYRLLVMDTKGYPDGKPVGGPYALQTFAIGNIVRELIGDQFPSILFKDPKNRWIVLTGIADTDSLSRKIADYVAKFHKIPLSLGVSPLKSAFGQIHTAYQEALTAFRIQSLSTESPYPDETRTGGDISGHCSSPVEIAALICSKEAALIEQGARSFIRHMLLHEGTEKREDIIRSILTYLSHIHVSLSETASRELEEIPIRVWESFDACQTLEDYEVALGGYLNDLADTIVPPKTNAMIERAVQMISERYRQDLSLQMIADELSIHPVWLSQLFKKEMGQTYMDYLSETRIEHAKGLLRETSMKVYEIAESAGYRDLQHFGATFKKRTGQTPKEYRCGK